MESFTTQLRSLHQAYLTGRTRPVVEISERDFQQEFEQDLPVTISATDRELLTRCTRFRVAALRAARAGDLNIADYLFSTSEKLLAARVLSPVYQLMAQSAHEAAVSYLDYQRQHFEISTERIYRALAIDEELEDTYGYSTYHIHRLRLLLNLVRLKRRQGEVKEAFDISRLVADYLEQKIAVLPLPTNWDSNRLASLPLFPKSFLFEQAISEIAFIVVGQEEFAETWRQHFQSHIDAREVANCQLSLHAHNWLQARAALLAREIDLYLERVEPLISAGPSAVVWLWYASIIDLALVCEEFPCAEAHALLQDLISDMSAWPWPRLPASWKRIFAERHISSPA